MALTGSYNFSYKWDMELKVRKIGNGYGVLFPKQVLEDMRVTEDAILNLEKVDGVYQIFPYDPEFAKALKVFRDTLPAHQNTYRELAK
jgi:antitoxin MazE